MPDVGRPDVLDKLLHVGAILNKLSTDWANHIVQVADTLEQNLIEHGFPVLRPTTSVEDGIIHLQNELDLLNSRIAALRRLNFQNLPSIDLQGLIKSNFVESTGTETAFWQFKRAMADAEYELDSVSASLISFERLLSKNFNSCTDMWIEAFSIEKNSLFQDNVERVDRMSGSEDAYLSKEDIIAGEHVAMQELMILTILHALSEREVKVARQRLITEFFDVA